MQASSCILYSGGHATSQATMNMWLNSKNKDPVSHGADAQSAGTRTHHTACESSPWWTRAVSPRYKHSTPKTGIDLTMLWRCMNNTAHIRVHEKGTKKWVMFPVVYASQSFWLPRQPHYSTPPLLCLNQGSCLHLLLWHHPVIIFSLKFLWWKMSHLFLPTQA